MTCEKCGYTEKQEKQIFNKNLCNICAYFAPQNKEDFNSYINEKFKYRLC